MNVALLKAVKKHIKEEPLRYSYSWGYSSNESPCGTKGCIAGWTMVLSGEITAAEMAENRWCLSDAARLLDITSEEARRLFIYWPDQFVTDINEAKQAIKRIDFFIKTKGTDVLPLPKQKQAKNKA